MKPTIKKPITKEYKEAETWPIWEKEQSRFPWQYDKQEKCLILEGRAIVETPEGLFEFGEGDYVIFPKGLQCTWEIKKKIRKHYSFG